MDIKRDKYLNDLINRMHNGMIKVVTGIRRCGKSYLLFNIFKNYLLEHGVTASHIITIELDQRKNKKYRDPDMVTEINATQVDTQDKLTDQVYHYDVTDKVFEKASRYEDRRIEKEESKTFAGTKKTPRREDVSL